MLTNSEETLAIQQYTSLTEGALNNVRKLAENELVHGSQIVAKHVGWAYPDADRDWPNVWLPSYWDIMEEVLPTSIWSGVNLVPIVWPDKAEAFEAFAYEKMAETFGDNSDTGATSRFGRGIWVRDEDRVHDDNTTTTTTDHRYHDTTGVAPYYRSPYHYMAPKLQDGLGFADDTMMNVHGSEIQGLTLDAVMNCSLARRQNRTESVKPNDRTDEPHHHRPRGCGSGDSDGTTTADCAPDPKDFRCTALSGMLPAKHPEDEPGISGFIATPIYPANDPYELVGFIFGTIDWMEVMTEIFPRDTIGIDCVFGDPAHRYTFTLGEDTSSTLLCEGDCHDTKYNDYMVTTTIVDPDLLSDGSVVNRMTCYPNDEFFRTYHTNNPTIAAIGAVGMILFTSLLFFLYDYFVRRELQHKKELFEAKRKFVRFVSHEVRTPMNSVCMGLSILQEEAAAALDHDDEETAIAEGRPQPRLQPFFGREQIEHWHDLANEISANAVASVDVLDDFLNYDKIATGEMNLEYTIVPIWNLIDDTVAEFKLPMAKKNITLRMSLPSANDLPQSPESWYKSGAFVSDRTLPKSNKQINAYASQKSCSFLSDDTIQKSNRHVGFAAGEDRGISDMEAGCKWDLLEMARKQRLVGDSVRITQVIRNLVSNAVKFTKEGGDISISTRFVKTGRRRRRKRMVEPSKETKTFELNSKEVITCEKSGEIVFTVKDSGAGLSKAQLKNLFGAGVQFDVNDLQSGKGSGLGLYIAKGIVEQHGGSLVADSDGKDLGCTFTMRLPIYGPPDDVFDPQGPGRKRRRSILKREGLDGTDGGGGDGMIDCTLESLASQDDGMTELKILLVDDSKSNRKLLCKLMTMRGHRCEEADDGHKGLEMAVKVETFGQPYDLIFMDYEMPTMTGPEAVRGIREHGSDVYIIGLTGNIMPDDVSYFRACGANAVFPKPFRVKDFERLLEENLSRDDQGRIVEKGSTVFDLTTFGLAEEEEEDISPFGRMVEEGNVTVDLDDTAVSSLGDPFDRGKL